MCKSIKYKSIQTQPFLVATCSEEHCASVFVTGEGSKYILRNIQWSRLCPNEDY